MWHILSDAIWFALIGSLTMAAFALADYMQRRSAMLGGGWRYLTPGPMVWGALIGGGVLTVLFLYIYFFVGSARADAESQMAILYFLTITFLLMTLFVAYVMAVETIRWNDIRIERRTLTFQHRDLYWTQLAGFGIEHWGGGYAWISDCDGNKLRFALCSNGAAELIATIAANLPADLPPAETATTLEAALVRAR